MRVFPHRYGESILLAVSGGVDSVVMAHLFLKKPVRLCIAHCNFHLRGEESDADASFVREWAAANAVECLVRDFDTLAYASSEGISIEMAARELRYRWFDTLCKERGFDGVCVAHNANDNVETLFLNLLRGTGLKGLCAMSPVCSNPYGSSKVFRPLLEYSRADIMEYAAEHSLAYRTDSSNMSSEFKRNRLRNEVFPILARINPSFIDTIGRDITLFNQAREIVDEYIGTICPDGLYSFSDNGLSINIEMLSHIPHSEYVLYGLLEPYGFNGSTLRNIVDLLGSDRVISGKKFFSAFYVAVTSTDKLVISRRDGILERLTGCSEGIAVELVDWNNGMERKTPKGVTLIDADALKGELRLRRWEDGDYLNPIGLHGKKKVSDLLTDLKYDILRKQNVFVVELDGHHVGAVVGERVDEALKITSSTRRVYRICV